MRLGGYVIHGNNRDTLERCLASLSAVCDEVVALDSQSTDGSVELARKMGVRSVSRPWRGYGAARTAAMEALGSYDYVFYLDSDEHLEPEALQTLREWRRSAPTAPAYRLPRRDWAELDGHRFLYRTEWRARLVRGEAAVWRPEMIVHEALPRMHAPRLHAPIEHRFATSLQGREAKEERYALLWAVRAFAEGRRLKPAALQRPAHLLRDCLVHGALWRGGLDALRLAWAVSIYHSSKYRHLGALKKGGFPELRKAFAEGRYEEVFALVKGQSLPASTSEPSAK
ncbi:glycosyltransferase family 2 protein [Cystobacter fuscus]|nr:glycosyltransferase family 2 protein [Cystobacter fuscus]